MATKFQSDPQGFIVGEKLLDNSDDILAVQTKALPMWREIRRDVRAIARAVGVALSPARRGSAPASAPAGSPGSAASRPRRAPAMPVGRGGSSAAVPTKRRGPATLPERGANGRFVAAPRRPAPDAQADQQRDGRGRFSDGGKAPRPDEPNSRTSEPALSRIADKLGRVSDSLAATEGLDPTLNAVSEIKSVVTPLGRGIGGLFGRNAERKKERWYTRFIKALATKRDGQQPAAGGRGAGGSGFLGTLFGSLFGTGGAGALLPFIGRMLSKVFLPVAAAWGSFKLGQWIGEKINTWLNESGMQAKLFDAVDWIKDSVGGAWQKVTAGFTSAATWLSELPGKLDAAVRAIPVVGAAYGKVADATKAAAAQVSAGYQSAQGQANDAPAPATLVQRVARAIGSGAGTVAAVPGNAGKLLAAGRAAGLSGMELANFMGQNAHESGGFTRLKENLNYSAAGLRKTFGRYIKTDSEAQALAGDPESIANRVYGGRMGNSAPGDGFKYRGRGFIQLTGKDNYAAASKALGVDLVNNPDLAADPAVAAQVSAWYWKNRVSAKGGGADVARATQLVNGGQHGLADRQRRVAEWQAKLTATASDIRTPAMPNMPPLVMANVPPSVPANLPQVPEVKEPPTKLNSGGETPRVSVNIPDRLGQDVGDRSLAHIVSGGIGS